MVLVRAGRRKKPSAVLWLHYPNMAQLALSAETNTSDSTFDPYVRGHLPIISPSHLTYAIADIKPIVSNRLPPYACRIIG